MGETTVLLVGCYQRSEFATAVRSLSDATTLLFASDAQEALANARELPIPDMVVLVQSRPGQMPQQGIHCLQQTWPLTQFVALLGSWCEGETRTGKPWPNVPRVYAHQWPSRLRGIGQLSLEITGCIGAEIQTSSIRANSVAGQLVAIYGRGYSHAEALGEALADAGFPVVCLSLTERVFAAGVATVLYEADREREQIVEDLDELRRRHPDAEIVAIEIFPRTEEIGWLGQRGVSAVVSQPFRVEDLVRQLQSLVSPESAREQGQPAA